MPKTREADTLAADAVIVGAGVTGLTTALRLAQARPESSIVVLEASDAVGGKIRTLRRDGFVVDMGPDVFLSGRAEIERLIDDLNLRADVRSVAVKAQIQRKGELYEMPDGLVGLVPTRLGPLLRSPLLGLSDRLRALAEPFVPLLEADIDETLEEFVVRRFGRGVYEHIVEPLVGGLYGADEPVSVAAVLPQLREMESRGGLIRGSRARPARRESPFRAFSSGMDCWPAAIAESALATGRVSINLDSPVTAIESVESGYRIATSSRSYVASAVVVTTSAGAACELLRPLDSEFENPLESIPQGSIDVVALGYRPDQVSTELPEGSGYLVPRSEGESVQAVTLYSQKHPGSAPPDHVLLRVFVRPEREGDEPAHVLDRAKEHVRRQLGVMGEPDLTATQNWANAMPRYTVGHLDRVAALDEACAAHAGLFLAGSSYRGPGLPACVADAERAAALASERLSAAQVTTMS